MPSLPGARSREGLDRILQANMGALIVVGDGPEVLGICSGGFLLDAEFSPQRLSELAKMDGAIILAADASRIARANVHLVPNPNVPTTETGTRHRTAERVARSIDVPVIAVSEDMSRDHPLPRRPQARPGLGRPAARPGQPGPADPGALPRPPRRRDQLACRRSRSRTWSPSAMWSPCCSGPRWCAASPRRSRATSSSSAPTAAWPAFSWRSCWPGVEDERRDVVRDYLPDDDPERADEAVAALGTMSTERLLDPPDGGVGARASATAWTSTPASSRAATGCWPGSPACPTPSSTTSSPATAACRR